MLSKSLSKLLRDDIVELNLENNFSEDGYLPLNIIMNINYIKDENPSLNDIIFIAENSDSDFDLKKIGDEYYIRANNGHSEDVNKLLKPEKFLTRIYTYLNEPENNCIHETFTEDIKSIMENGITKMNDEDYIRFESSMNSKSAIHEGYPKPDILLYIDMEKALQDGVKFYVSKNGVILTKGNQEGILEPKYIKHVVEF